MDARAMERAEAGSGQGGSWARHYPKVLLVLGLLGFWEVALRFLKWEVVDQYSLRHHLTCLSCWILEFLLPYGTWLALAALPTWASWRWRLDRRPRWRMASGHLVAMALHAGLTLLVLATTFGFIQHHIPEYGFRESLSMGFRTFTLEKTVYWTWNAVLNYAYLALAAHILGYLQESRDRAMQAARAEARLSETQLQTLKSQLQPRFLFNALAGIHALIAVDDPGARRMVNLLSDFLRRSMADADHHTVPLRQELDVVDLYLQIQQIPRGGRLQVIREVEPDCLEARVPHLILLPLVEDAVLHGIASGSEPAILRILISREGSLLRLRVLDDGSGDAGGVTAGRENAEERLRQVYGGRAGLAPAVRGGGVNMWIPLAP